VKRRALSKTVPEASGPVGTVKMPGGTLSAPARISEPAPTEDQNDQKNDQKGSGVHSSPHQHKGEKHGRLAGDCRHAFRLGVIVRPRYGTFVP
jgi:hypothetical protein